MQRKCLSLTASMLQCRPGAPEEFAQPVMKHLAQLHVAPSRPGQGGAGALGITGISTALCSGQPPAGGQHTGRYPGAKADETCR